MADIVVIEDETVLARNIAELLGMAGHDVRVVGTGQEGVDETRKDPPDLVLLDFRLPDIDGFEVLRRLHEDNSRAAVVMMTAHGNIPMAVRAMKAGVGDFLCKPLDLDELQLIVAHALRRHRNTRSLEYFKSRDRLVVDREPIIGESNVAEKLRVTIKRLAQSKALESEVPPSVLITGETGTGKDLAARVLHYAGPRKNAQFVHVNCTALPERLIESELFGHTKGAFTDARGDKAGLFEVADCGTIFLDEIGHMKGPLQAKLLHVLEHRTLRRLGATRERSVNVHVIAATNRDLLKAVEAGEFRRDLYHRLCTLSIHLDPLREREGDICVLAEHFRREYALKFGLRITSFSLAARQRMLAYRWPGNVRELSHVVESAVLLADRSEIDEQHLNLFDNRSTIEPVASHEPGKTITIDFDADPPTLNDVEQDILHAALVASNHNVTRAARLLGISRDAVRYRLERGSLKN